jgi:hypothetical protein
MSQQDWKARKQAGVARREYLQTKGIDRYRQATLPNTTCPWQCTDEEQERRQQTVEEQLKVFRSQLPVLLKRFEKIPDPRNPHTSRHKLTVLLLYGILTFVYNLASRREANRELTRPQFEENLRTLFPELESLAHHDTLKRLLDRIDVEQIQEAHLDLIRGLFRNKKFRHYLVDRRYLIAIDGTQKHAWRHCFSDEALQYQTPPANSQNSPDAMETRYSVYVLEANLVLPSGIALPLLSEFLTYDDGNPDSDKQDCELKAFARLAKRLKDNFPRLPVMLLLDGLYPNGPLFALCQKYGWQFMMVLKARHLPLLWEEFQALRSLLPEQTLKQNWKGRQQVFSWVNDLPYEYGPNGRHRATVHVVACDETEFVLDPHSGDITPQTKQHVWVSSHPLSRKNVHTRCNLMARRRWDIENCFLVEKHQGYHYEHCYAYSWKALKGYHYLMRIAHCLNQLLRLSVGLAEFIVSLGVQPFLRFLRDTMTAPWLQTERLRPLLTRTPQLRFT